MLILFYIVALIMTLAAIGVVLLRNPLHSALSLILCMIGVAILFAMLQAHFLAVVQLIVYAGAIMVLVLFVLMLLNFKQENLKAVSLPVWMLTFFSGGLLLYFLIPILNKSFAGLAQKGSDLEAAGTLKEGTVEALGELLFTKYVFTFEVASILIMAALVGAVMVGSRSIHRRTEIE